MTDLATLTAREMVAGYRRREFSPLEVMRATLDRIEQIEPKIQSIVYIDPSSALHMAKAAESAILSGEPVGELHGVPIGVKDVIDVEGMPTTCHSHHLIDNIATRDARAVRRLKSKGALPFCKLATHEFALGGPSFDLPFPPARNPWNTSHHPGGSSTGSGAAVAAGLMPIAVGTDTAGSIRHPAAACGILGLKPTFGAVSVDGVFPLSFSLDHVGPLARNVDDLRLAFGAMASGEESSPMRRTGAVEAKLLGLRVGYVEHFHREQHPHREIASGLQRLVDTLSNMGASVELACLPPLTEFAPVHGTILFSEAFAIHADWLRKRPERYGALCRQRLLIGAFLTAEDYIQAQRSRRRLVRSVEELFARFDVLLTANMFDLPARLEDAHDLARTLHRQARVPFNLTGHPAISIPTGLSSSGLPTSAQIVGPLHSEETLFQLSDALFDQAIPVVSSECIQ